MKGENNNELSFFDSKQFDLDSFQEKTTEDKPKNDNPNPDQPGNPSPNQPKSNNNPIPPKRNKGLIIGLTILTILLLLVGLF
jgi:hypothetical protein